MATSLPNSSSHQPRRYRQVDHHGQPRLEHFDSIEDAGSFAIRCISNSPLANRPVGLGLAVSAESDS